MVHLIRLSEAEWISKLRPNVYKEGFHESDGTAPAIFEKSERENRGSFSESGSMVHVVMLD